VIVFEIPGDPVSWKRPRANGKRFFVDAKTAAYKAKVAAVARDLFPEPVTGPVKMAVYATFCPPKSWSKKKTAEHLSRPHTQKPDGDNIAKAIKDALNGTAYHDDAQVSDLHVRKLWGPTARVVVTIEGTTK
jgi:Holliday junction resolvase RusA-like endonuclease